MAERETLARRAVNEANARGGDWMQTASGRQYWPVDPRPDEVCIEDIAHALSLTCRYSGHCREFYSVAQHSVLVAENCPPAHRLWGLLHDASEAYVADIVRPLKPSLAGYKAIEALNMAAICDRFGLSREMPPEVNRVDNAILADEAMQIMAPPPAPWNLPEPPLGIAIKPWSPALAKREFLALFAALHGMDPDEALRRVGGFEHVSEPEEPMLLHQESTCDG